MLLPREKKERKRKTSKYYYHQASSHGLLALPSICLLCFAGGCTHYSTLPWQEDVWRRGMEDELRTEEKWKYKQRTRSSGYIGIVSYRQLANANKGGALHWWCWLVAGWLHHYFHRT